MVERWTIDGFTYCPTRKDDGGFVRHSDYAALEALLAERVKVEDVLDAASEYMKTQYGIGALSHPTDRGRILSAIEATPPAPCVHPIWGQDIDGTRTCGKCGLTTPPTHPEPDFSKSIAGIIKEESAKGAAVGWRSCTGCHETNEGYETGHFPYSKMFGCYVGSGCNECGGIGVTWEYWSEDVLKTMAEDDAPPAPKVTEADMDDAAVAALVALARHNIPTDIQELLVRGDPMRSIPPGALSKSFAAALKTITAAQESGQ